MAPHAPGAVDALGSFSAHPINLPLHAPHGGDMRRAGSSGSDTAAHPGQRPPPGLAQEALQLAAIAGPLFVEGVAAIGEQLVATACVGRLPGAVPLSSLVLSQAIYNVSGYSVVSGLASALETLCGQAFGAGKRELLATMLVRAQLVCACAVLPTALAWGSGALAWLLPQVGQEPAIAAPTSQCVRARARARRPRGRAGPPHSQRSTADRAPTARAGRLLQLMVPALGLSVLTETTVQFLLAQGLAWPGMAASLAGLALSPVLNWGLVWWAGLGLPGAALAMVAVQGTLVVILLSYMLLRECRPAAGGSDWRGFRLADAVKGWGQYLSLGVPCVVMVCAEWWVWEVLVLLAGWLPSPEIAVAVMGLSTQLSLLPWMLCYAIGTATATRTAQALGAGSAAGAARVCRLACVLSLVSSLGLCAAVWLARGPMVAALTRDLDIQEQLKHVLPVVVAAILCDGQVAVLSGVLRGAGRQLTGAWANWISYWAVGMPVAWMLGAPRFAGWGVWGLRAGLTVAVATQALILHALVATLDWGAEVARAQQLLEDNGASGGEAGGGEAAGDGSGLAEPLLRQADAAEDGGGQHA
ncbi:DTX14 [Scenedesmus sp. PABB004]|nr:DTX14 [Scenedesmus sp. PABB004]